MSRTSHAARNEQGQAIVIMAFIMIGLLAFLALAIDGGNTFVERRRAQNAADAGALAGARTLWIQRTQGNEFESTVLQSINAAAEANGVEDTDGAPGNHINANVEAFYTDREGVDLPGSIEVGALGVIPPGAEGIRVIAQREFTGFFTNLIGRPDLAADAAAIAVIVPPKGCGDFAIFAGCVDCAPNTLKTTGSSITINGGGLHSNDDIHIGGGGQGIEINDGFIEYDSDCKGCDNKVETNNGATPTQTDPYDMPELWQIEDFRPGGTAATQAGAQYHYVNGNLNALDGDGLYYVTGEIKLHAPIGNVTLVAEGQIEATGSANIHTFRQDWPLLFTTSSNSSQGAIKISGSDAQWTGFLYAPNGLVTISAASNSTMQGAIYANEVDLSGANIFINYDPAFCPPKRARVILLK
jgi:hypothetical protein